MGHWVGLGIRKIPRIASIMDLRDIIDIYKIEPAFSEYLRHVVLFIGVSSWRPCRLWVVGFGSTGPRPLATSSTTADQEWQQNVSMFIPSSLANWVVYPPPGVKKNPRRQDAEHGGITVKYTPLTAQGFPSPPSSRKFPPPNPSYLAYDK